MIEQAGLNPMAQANVHAGANQRNGQELEKNQAEAAEKGEVEGVEASEGIEAQAASQAGGLPSVEAPIGNYDPMAHTAVSYGQPAMPQGADPMAAFTQGQVAPTDFRV
ncbi:hypothetical protein B0H94_104143 [Salsuginibacillus halophilus]|uniref:Uncharacterized protein n=1 Tax=Salsuginibacillus halophilus TaxID=517424 RepID=A0A2P8HQT0_9BACI|nr:hypothetical protein [Salsuginibacillus halophilus]PSL48542.1 hypothetical protein B0H94_104143 [Salsuginibacillus halophilus]